MPESSPPQPDDARHAAELSDPELSAVDHIGEGLEIDWPTLERRHPESTGTWRRLRLLDEVARAFRDTATPPEASMPPADTWGPLDVGEKLGEGSFGEVFRAFDPKLRRHVALKLTRLGAGADERRRSLEEARLLARLDHPGIVKVYGAGEHGGRSGLWMDLLPGRTLEQRLAADGRFSEAEVLETARQLAAALQALHDAGLVHGDVKASNVLRRDGGALVLGDLGSGLDLRRPTQRAPSASPLTAAPELLQGRAVDRRADLYSLGVLLFLLATGRYPFEGENISELIAAHQSGAAPDLRRLRPDFSTATANLIARALAVDPADRWSDAADMTAALSESESAADKSRAIPARPDRLVRWLVAGATALLTGLLLWQIRPGAGPVTNAPPPTAPGPTTFTSLLESRSLKAELRRAGDSRPLTSGDRLRVGDRLHLQVTGHRRPLWLYLANADSEGRVHRLFPLADAEPDGPRNPVALGTQRLPGKLGGVEMDWLVDSRAGGESFLIVVADSPLPALEAALDLATAAGLPAPATEAAEGTASNPAPRRGVGALSPADMSSEALNGLAGIAEEAGAHFEIVALLGTER